MPQEHVKALWLGGLVAAALTVGPGLAAEPQPMMIAQAAPSSSSNSEDIFWQSIQNSQDPAMFQAYLDQVKQGVFRGTYKPLAEIKLKSLGGAAPAAATPSQAPAPAPEPEPAATPPAAAPAPATPPPQDAAAPLSPENAEIVEACDRAAAHPFDTTKPSNLPGIEIDEIAPGAALRACLKAADVPGAPPRVFFELGRAYDKSGNRRDATLQFAKAAQLGHARSILNLGIIATLGGRGVKRDYQMARSWFDKAADAGEPDALVETGKLYMDGRGVRRNYTRAVELYNEAMSKGSIQAYSAMAFAYRVGHGVRRNTNKACQLDQDGAAKGNLTSTSNIRKYCRYR